MDSSSYQSYSDSETSELESRILSSYSRQPCGEQVAHEIYISIIEHLLTERAEDTS